MPRQLLRPARRAVTQRQLSALSPSVGGKATVCPPPVIPPERGVGVEPSMGRGWVLMEWDPQQQSWGGSGVLRHCLQMSG